MKRSAPALLGLAMLTACGGDGDDSVMLPADQGQGNNSGEGAEPVTEANTGPKPCTESTFADCDPSKIGYGTPFVVSGVETISELRDSNGDGQINELDASWQLYKKLLGPRFKMPEHPRLRFIFNDIRLGTAVPVVQDFGPTKYDTRYLEYGVELLVRYGPYEHWRDLRLVLNNLFGFETGRGGTIAKFLGDMVYDQAPDHPEGFATAHVEDRFVMSAHWRPADLERIAEYNDPSQSRRFSDGTEDGDPWAGVVSIGSLVSLPGLPLEWLTGQELPFDNPTAMPDPVPVLMRVRVNSDLDQFNVAPTDKQSLADPDPLPDLFDEEAGESFDVLFDSEQELIGMQYGPQQQLLIVEGFNVVDEGHCADRSDCEDPAD
ncbi:MAG: hypothetical protein R3352_05780 [Salinisphaeraceae bacterium]|nr:hypothetical protein [Salinisphaeraceae bacterium]